MPIAVHVTHEAVQQVGGIGTVLRGLVLSKNYSDFFPQTLLYAPSFTREGDVTKRLGPNSEVLYSGLDHLDTGDFRQSFSEIEKKYGVHVLYGHKKFYSPHSKRKGVQTDILTIDPWDMHRGPIQLFKYKLWKHFEIQSDLYEQDRDYEQYLRIGIVLREVVEALYGREERAVVFAHEYMGMPSALAFAIEKTEGRRLQDTTIFYAHEVSTARVVVEQHPGHDFTFYNLLRNDRSHGVSLEDEFGSYRHYSRNELIKRASSLDYIFAVSDITKEEFLYLCPLADEDRIKIVYNGLGVEELPYEQKERSLQLLRDYCAHLFNFRPDSILTHVARLVISKGIWRDIRLLYHLDDFFVRKKIKGFFVLLSTQTGAVKSPEDIGKMESDYGWPVVHREGWPDLIGTEVDIYRYLELFNGRSRAIKGIFVNQFGFSHGNCGQRLPETTSLLSLRLASDIEFGLSIYEPFGIAQIETVPFGGTPVISSVCGCLSLLENCLPLPQGTCVHVHEKDFLSIDFTKVPPTLKHLFETRSDFMKATKEVRDLIETEICQKYAPQIMNFLPASDRVRKQRFQDLQKRAHLLDWDHIATRIISHLR